MTCQSDGSYQVLLRIKLLSGGSPDKEREYTSTITVVEGKGTFSTYDWADLDKLEKPEYKTEIIGYVPLNSVE